MPYFSGECATRPINILAQAMSRLRQGKAFPLPAQRFPHLFMLLHVGRLRVKPHTGILLGCGKIRPEDPLSRHAHERASPVPTGQHTEINYFFNLPPRNHNNGRAKIAHVGPQGCKEASRRRRDAHA